VALKMRGFVCFLVAFFPWATYAQDLSVYGILESYLIPITPRKQSEIYGKCFKGIGLVTCEPTVPDDDIVYAYNLDYYNQLGGLVGQFYCLQCCGSNPDFQDVWELSCPLSVTGAAIINVYGNEFRLARKQTLTDTEVIICPIKRSACNYTDAGVTLGCDRAGDLTYLHGYTITITVQEYDFGFAYWKGVSSCVVESDERYTEIKAGDVFYEKIIMNYKPIDTFSIYDTWKVVIIGVSILLFIYVSLYFLRRKRCDYCQQKLVFSYRMCYKCVIVGAQRPDPVLLKALEERGLFMQGKPPERFGFLQVWCVERLKCCYDCFTCKCCCYCIRWCCFCCFKKEKKVLVHPVGAFKPPPMMAIPIGHELLSLKPPSEVAAAMRMQRMNDSESGGDLEDGVQVFGEDQTVEEENPAFPEVGLAASSKSNIGSSGKGFSGKFGFGGGGSSAKAKIDYKAAKLAKQAAALEKKQARQLARDIERDKKIMATLARKKKRNPNIVEYHPQIVYETIKHPAVLK
jgi:hypothetical protein